MSKKKEEAVIRIDITGAVRSGKTFIAAFIVDALRKASPEIPMGVVSREGDFLDRLAAVSRSEVIGLRLDKIIIVDRSYSAAEVEVGAGEYTYNVGYQPPRKEELLEIVQSALLAQGSPDESNEQILSLIRNDPKFVSLTQEITIP